MRDSEANVALIKHINQRIEEFFEEYPPEENFESLYDLQNAFARYVRMKERGDHPQKWEKPMKKTIEDALREGRAEGMAYELTPERRVLLQAVCEDIIDLLRKRTSGPVEGIITLHFVQSTLEETSGIALKGMFTVKADEVEH